MGRSQYACLSSHLFLLIRARDLSPQITCALQVPRKVLLWLLENMVPDVGACAAWGGWWRECVYIRGLACMVPARGGARAVKKIALEFLPPDLGA